MEDLLEKIRIYTDNGPPSVSELIDLQELARKSKITRGELDKLIQQSLLSPKNYSDKEHPEFTDDRSYDTEYKRPELDLERNAFEAEMNKRRVEESIFDSSEVEINQPDVVFPEFEDPFSKQEENTEIVEINDEIKSIEEETQRLIEETEKFAELERKRQEEEFNRQREEAIARHEAQKRLEEEKQNASNQFKQEDIGDVSPENADINPYEVSNEPTTANKPVEKVTYRHEEADGIDDWISQSNEAQRKKVEELVKKKNQSQAPKNQKKEKKKQRSYARDSISLVNPDFVKVTKTSFALGLASMVISFLFGFIGIFVGVYALTKANSGLKSYNLSPSQFEKGAQSKLKNARTMALIGIVIGAFKFLRVFFLPFYF